MTSIRSKRKSPGIELSPMRIYDLHKILKEITWGGNCPQWGFIASKRFPKEITGDGAVPNGDL